VPCFFFPLFKFERGTMFFSFFFGSLCVPTMFLLSSHQVPNMFPNMFSIATHFYPIDKMLSSFHLYRSAQGEELYTSNSIEHSILWNLHSFIFLEWWANQIVSLPPKKNWTWKAPHLINRRGELNGCWFTLPKIKRNILRTKLETMPVQNIIGNETPKTKKKKFSSSPSARPGRGKKIWTTVHYCTSLDIWTVLFPNCVEYLFLSRLRASPVVLSMWSSHSLY
jgi:hypothetical protein